MAEMVKLTIDGVNVEVPAGTTVLQAAHQVGINIPTLCYLKDINQIGACRLCVVDTGARALQAACVLPVANNMVVRTNTPAIRQARKINLELLLSNHDKRCLSCSRNRKCELQALCHDLGVQDTDFFAGSMNKYDVDDLSPSIVRDNNKCVLCRRCVAACNMQGIGVIGPVNRGFNTAIESPWNAKLNDMACINCGQCVAVCPVGALYEKSEVDKVWQMLADPELTVIVQAAPAVRAALGEEFGMPMGTSVTGKMVAALRRLGFNRVYDTDWGADLTIMEESAELLDRLKNGGVLPMITSCSPGWVKFCETYYSDFIPNLSTCKSPHEMEGAMIKAYWANRSGIDPLKVRVVSVMPCTAKKFEAQRPEMGNNGMRDVDAVLTTRELAGMIKTSGVDFARLKDENFDHLMGESTGAGVIFGATGGVMEAALRTAYEVVTGKELEDVNFTQVRGLESVKEASIDLNGTILNIAVVHGTANAAKLLDQIRAGEKQYAFIEIMGCPGGCVNGGGQPFVSAKQRLECDHKALRARALYCEDEQMELRKSHLNPSIKKLYSRLLGEPNSHKAHELLHTTYTARPKYQD